VAAYRADEFFRQPCVASFTTLLKAAARAGVEAPVRAAALRFLETGVRPTARPAAPTAQVPSRSRPVSRGRATGAATTGEACPLPPLPQRPSPGRRGRAAPDETGPHLDVLLDLAIEEKRPDDVLAWYDRLRTSRRSPWRGYVGREEQVADAVATAHPERALALYRKRAEDLIAQTSPSAYEEAARYLRKARKVLHRLGRDAEWDRIVADIREKNARKRRLLETLDRLANRRIIDS
jgi:uncharacterized Zn finger protein